jgi:putative flippase GtrA
MIKKLIERRTVRYLFFGGMSALIEFLTFLLLDLFLPTYLSALMSFLCGLCASFIFNKLFVFGSRSRGGKQIMGEAAPFLVLGLANSQVNAGLTWLLAHWMLPMLAKCIVMGVVAVYNYFIMGSVIFARGRIGVRPDAEE